MIFQESVLWLVCDNLVQKVITIQKNRLFCLFSPSIQKAYYIRSWDGGQYVTPMFQLIIRSIFTKFIFRFPKIAAT